MAQFHLEPCIELIISEIKSIPQSDWVFFSSPMGVRLFFAHYALSPGCKIGVLGPGTLRALETYGRKAAFSSELANPDEVIRTFCNEINPTATVLVPRSEISLQRFRKYLHTDRLLDFPFYSNTANPPQKPFAGDVLIFTSPSNARAYFSAHHIMPHQIAVAIGQATYDALQAFCPDSALRMGNAPTEEALWAAAVGD